MEISFTTLAQEQQLTAINICGTPCVGNCQTCVQSNADLNAFYGLPQEETTAAPEPVEVQVMAPAGDENPEDEALEVARGMDALQEALRSGEDYDEDEEEDEEDEDRYGCHCLDCVNRDVPGWINYDGSRNAIYEDDGGYGLDWNESGYFD